MGFYGNATYYLPNGIAKDVVKDAITTEKLAKDAVIAEKLAKDAVTAEKIAPKAIQGSEGNKLNSNDENSSHIASKSIGTDDIADNAVTGGAELPSGGRSIIAPHTITGYNIQSKTIKGSGDINGANNIENSHIGENTIGLSNMGKNSIDKEQIIKSAVYGSGDSSDYQHIAPGSIGTNDVAKETITGSMEPNQGHIAPHTITGYNIDYRTIDGSGDISGANDMELSHIGTNTIGLSNMGKNSIGKEQIINKNIYGSGDVENYPDYQHIAPGSIGTNDVADNAITEEKLANTYLKVNYYLDEEAPTTLAEIRELLCNSAIRNTMFYFYLNNSSDPEAATMNGLTPGSYQAYPRLMHANGAPGCWYLHNLSTDEHWEIEAYGSSLRKIYLNDYIDTNLKEYDSVIELKNDLDQYPLKTYIIGMQQAVSNLPSGRYVALPTHEQIGIMKSNRILINLTTGVSYTLRTTSANTVIVSTFAGHPTANSEWIISNNFTNTTVSNDGYGIGQIKLSNTVKYTDLPFATTKYLIRDYELLENEEFSTECQIVAMVPTHEIMTSSNPGQSRLINSTGKQLFITGVLGNSVNSIPSGDYWNIPFKDLSGADIQYGYDTAFLFKMTITNINSSTIQCNIDFVTSQDAPW